MSECYQIYTLIDVSNASKNSLRNFNGLLQTIGLNAQPFFESSDLIEITEDVKQHKFGSSFKGTHKIWVFTFIIEPDDVFSTTNSNTGSLEFNLNGVPICLGCNETAKITVPAFITVGKFTNTYIVEFNKTNNKE